MPFCKERHALIFYIISIEITISNLLHGDMEASLFYLIFYKAPVAVSHISQHFAEHPFQGVILHLSARLLTSLNLLISVVANIKGSTVKMA